MSDQLITNDVSTSDEGSGTEDLLSADLEEWMENFEEAFATEVQGEDKSADEEGSRTFLQSLPSVLKGRVAKQNKNEPSRFLGDGVSFRAKLIGILEVGEARGERMCQEALADLKMAVRAAGEHKQRIVVCVAIDGLRLRDDKTGDCLYHHPVHKISFIAQDMTDSRAFGYIFGSPDTGHRFFGIKTDKAASQVVIAMRDLFQVVFELKKKEIEMAKQHIEQQQQLKYSSSGASKYSDLSSKESGDQGKMRTIAEDQQETGGGTSGGRGSRRHISSSAAVVAISPPPRHPNALQHQQQTSEVIADLLDLEIELSSIQAGIHQMEKMTPSDPFGPGATTPSAISSLHIPPLPAPTQLSLSPTVSVEDPFGDSFVGPSNIPTALPPPPSSAAAIPLTSSSLSIQGCKAQRQGSVVTEPSLGNTSGGIADSSWFERPLGSEDLFGEVLPQVGDTGAGREQEKENLNGNASQIAMGVGDFSSGKGLASAIGDDKGSANTTQFDVFTELDPLGTGRSRPYVDKKDFFQDLKNPPKKVLRDLVSGTDSPSTHSAAPLAAPAPSAPAATPFCSSTATVPLFHAMFDANDPSQSAADLFASSDLFFPPSAGVSFPAVASSHTTSVAKDLSRFPEGVFPSTTSDNFAAPASSVVPTSPLLSSITSATDSTVPTAEDPFADTDPFADEASAPVAVSLSDVDVAGIFPRIEDDPFDTELADFATISTSRRKRIEYSVSGSATVGRKPRSSKGITHGPLRVSLPPEKKSLDSPVLLPPPPSDGSMHSTGTIPRSRSRSPRVARQASAGCSTSPKSAVQQQRRGGPVARTPSEGAYSSSPQSPPEPPPRPPSSGDAGAKPPPLPPKRVSVGPTTPALPTPLRQSFPDDEDASQYEFIDQYETSPRPTVESKTIPRSAKKTTGLPPPPRRQHQRTSPSGEPSAVAETAKRAAVPTEAAVSAARSLPPQGVEAAPPPATSFDLTLAELGRMSIADLASALHIPPERVSTMTLQELAEKLSACRTKASVTSDKEEDYIKRDRYAALRESLDDEFASSSATFNADFDAKFDEEFNKEDGPKIVDDVFRETSFDKYAVFRELIDSEADVNEKADEINDGAAPTEEETGSVGATEEVRGISPQNDASDVSKEGDVCSPTREQEEEKESVEVKEEEEESSREEAADKYAALREICLAGEKLEEAGAAAETNSSEERNEKAPEEAVTGDLLVLSRQASEAAEEGKAESGAATEEGDIAERKEENAGWANFDAEKATDGGESEEAASPWSSESREAVGWGGEAEGAWGSEGPPRTTTKQKAEYGSRTDVKRGGVHRGCRWRRSCPEDEEEEEEELEEERRGRRPRRNRKAAWVEEEVPRRRCWEEDEAWARRTGRGTCWNGAPRRQRAPPLARPRKPSTWGDEEDEGEEEEEWAHRGGVYERREEDEERWRAKKRRGRRRTGSLEWDAEEEDEGEEGEEEAERGRWRRRQAGPSWEEGDGGWGTWGAEGGRAGGARQRGGTRGRSYRSWDEEDEAEEDYREGEGRWAGEEEEEGGERRRVRRVRTASGEGGGSSRSATQYPRHFRHEQEEAVGVGRGSRERGREREGGTTHRRRTAAPPSSSGPRKSAPRWQQQHRRGEEEEEDEEEEDRWGRRSNAGATVRGARRGRQRGKEPLGKRTTSRGSSGGRLQSPFEDDFVHATGGGGSSVSSDVSERSPVVHNGRCSDDVFLPCDTTAFESFPEASSTVQRPFSAPVEGARNRTERPRGGARPSGAVSSSVHRAQRQQSAELGNGNLRKSESVNIFARDSDPFDDDFFSSGNSCGDRGGRIGGQKASSAADPFKWTEPFGHFEFREEEEEEDDEEEEREREGATATEGAD